jgi:integrase
MARIFERAFFLRLFGARFARCGAISTRSHIARALMQGDGSRFQTVPSAAAVRTTRKRAANFGCLFKGVMPEKNHFSSMQDSTLFSAKSPFVEEARGIVPRSEPRWLVRRASIPERAPSLDLAELAHAVDEDLARPDHAPATERAYTHDWADFAAFCGRHGLEPVPAAPQTLALYLKSLQTQRSRSPAGLRDGVVGLSLPTLRRRLAAIASCHATEHLETPTDHPLVKKLLRRYSRARGTAAKKKEALTIDRLATIVASMADDLAAQRDRALLLLGYAGAFRRSELVTLDVEHLRFSKKGLYVWIAAAKNDPRKKGRELYVPRLPTLALCAVAALENWLDTGGTAGPVFRSFDLRGALTPNRLDAGDVARVLRRRAAAAGVAGDFAGHSLRRGFITNAAKKKVPIENIKRVTGQRSNTIVLDYVAAATLDDDPPLLEIVSSG